MNLLQIGPPDHGMTQENGPLGQYHRFCDDIRPPGTWRKSRSDIL